MSLLSEPTGTMVENASSGYLGSALIELGNLIWDEGKLQEKLKALITTTPATLIGEGNLKWANLAFSSRARSKRLDYLRGKVLKALEKEHGGGFE